MPKLYCRVNLRTDLQKRDRAGLRFSRDWTELTDVDDATLAALEEDPYLEVSDTPTVLVEVAATVQTATVEAAGDLTTPPESTTQQDSADAAQGDSEQAGTASAVGDDQSVVETDPRMDAIKSAIAQLDSNNADHWLSDGKPNIDAIAALTGFKVLAAERDQAWNQIKTQAAAD